MNVPLAAEPIAQIAGLTITNSMVNAGIVSVFLIVVAAVIRFRMKLVPSGVQNIFEFLVEFYFKTADNITHDRARSKKFMPLVLTLFIFILLNNWLGQLPGTGSIGVWGYMHGTLELIPIFRPATSDLNLTLALGILTIGCTHLFGIFTLGAWRHGNKFIQITPLFKSLFKGPVAALRGIIEFGVGLIEMVGEVARVISLSLRLFGNIFAGEVLLTVMLSLAAYIIPLPFQALELLVGVIQAMVFSMLALVFLTLATEPPHGEHEPAHATAAHE